MPGVEDATMNKLLLAALGMISLAMAGSQALAHDRSDDGYRRSYSRGYETRDNEQWRCERERRERYAREMRARYEWEHRERCDDRRRDDDRHHGFRGFFERAFR